MACRACVWPADRRIRAAFYAAMTSSGIRADPVLAKWAALNTKQCPGCRQLVERSEGCDHMSCVCGADFCFLCGMDYQACLELQHRSADGHPVHDAEDERRRQVHRGPNRNQERAGVGAGVGAVHGAVHARAAAQINRGHNGREVGEALYVIVERNLARIRHRHWAGKVTGMLLELPAHELQRLMYDERVLESYLEDAVEVLVDAGYAAPAPVPLVVVHSPHTDRKMPRMSTMPPMRPPPWMLPPWMLQQPLPWMVRMAPLPYAQWYARRPTLRMPVSQMSPMPPSAWRILGVPTPPPPFQRPPHRPREKKPIKITPPSMA